MVYLPTITTKINQLYVNIPYMDGMGVIVPCLLYKPWGGDGVAKNVHQLRVTRPLDPSCVEADITRRPNPGGKVGGFVQLEVGQLSHKLNEMI